MGAHQHDHSGHSHSPSPDADQRWIALALALILLLMVGEVAVGIAARSLALLSDAAHMLTDATALGLALIAVRLAARPPQGGYTFGLQRAEILSALANGTSLVLLAIWLAVEAVGRLLHPLPVHGAPVLLTALVGAAVNVVAAWSTSRADRTSLNVEGAFQHLLTDLFAFIATAIAGAILLVTGWERADAVASLVVVVLMVRAGAALVRASGRILLEAAPAHLDPDALGAELAGRPGVIEVHDLHVWQISSGQAALSAHVIAAEGADCHAVRRDLELLLRTANGIGHTTLQVDHREDEAAQDQHCDDPHGAVHRPPSRATASGIGPSSPAGGPP